MRRIILLLGNVLFAAILGSCTSDSVSIEMETASKTPLVELAITLPTSTSVIEATSFPTLSSRESEVRISNFLENNGNCTLPCIWGIQPGQTDFSEAKVLFGFLGWKGGEDYGVYYTGKDVPALSMNFRVAIYPPNGKIEKLHISISGNDFINKIGYFSFENLINKLGTPTSAYLFIGVTPGVMEPAKTSFELLLHYERINTLIEYVGVAIRHGEFYRFCPSHPNSESTQVNPMSGNVSVYVGNSDQESNPKKLVRPFWVLPNYYTPIEQSLEMNVEDFYAMASENNGVVCFDSPLSAWVR